jgi:hypothetical protein
MVTDRFSVRLAYHSLLSAACVRSKTNKVTHQISTRAHDTPDPHGELPLPHVQSNQTEEWSGGQHAVGARLLGL